MKGIAVGYFWELEDLEGTNREEAGLDFTGVVDSPKGDGEEMR